MKNLLKKGVTLFVFTLLSSMCVAQNSTDSQQGKKFDWKTVPVFTTQIVLLTDDNGNPLLNEDGTQQKRVFLVDQFGNRRSKESVKAQHKAITKAVGRIIGKVGLGALIGGGLGYLVAKNEGASNKDALGYAAAGAAVGMVGGYAITDEDRAIAKEHKKSLKEQKKLIEQYSKTFTDEGIPVDAKVDLTNVKGIDFTKGDAVSLSASEVMREIESDAFNNTDTSAWDLG